MLDVVRDLIHRLASAADNPVYVIIELVLIGLVLNWCVDKLEGTRGTRPLRRLLLVLVVVTLAVRIMTVRFGWERLDILYRFFVISVAFIALVAFQPELRRAFMRVGDVWGARAGVPQARVIAALVKAAGYLSRNKYGGLVAIQRAVDLRGWAENGTRINAEVSSNLLCNIFFPNSPLHDLGAIVVADHVLAANCQFPAVESDEIDAALGSRHLAAVGMSYETDALVLVVSEETGTVSLADNGKLQRYLTLDDLEHELQTRLAGTSDNHPRHGPSTVSAAWHVLRRILLVLPLTVGIWYLADQATQVELDNVQVVLRPVTSPDQSVEIVKPVGGQLTLRLRGSNRNLEALRRDATSDVIQLDWPQNPLFGAPGQHQPEATSVLQQIPRLRELGLDVRGVRPETLTVQVARLEARSLPVKIDGGEYVIAESQISPREVRVTLPEDAWKELRPEQMQITLPVSAQLQPVDGTQHLTVAVTTTLGRFKNVACDPTKVEVTLRIVQQSRDFAVVGVRVRLRYTQADWERYVQERYQLVLVEPLEWVIDKLPVRSSDSAVTSLTADEVDAYVDVTPDLFAAVGEERRLPVTVRLPAGVTLVGQPPLVRVRLELQPGGH